MTVRDMRRSMTIKEFKMWYAYASHRTIEWEKKTQKGKKQMIEVW